MANKQYTIVKDGEKLKDVKTLAAAKKLADAEGAAVLCDGRCVYEGAEALSASGKTKLPGTEPAVEVSAPVKYMLTALMNIRRAPSVNAEKAGTAKRGTIVEITAVKGDWLCLTDGTFILYEGGRFARKI